MAPQRRALNGRETGIHQLLSQMHQFTRQVLETTLDSLDAQDCTTADRVPEKDDAIDLLKYQVEGECIKTIALHQPVASDLRDLISDIHIANELERIADLTVSIARIVVKQGEAPWPALKAEVVDLGRTCLAMLDQVMSAYIAGDEAQARTAAARDDEVDAAEARIVSQALAAMNDAGGQNTAYTYLLWISHNLERIGDRVTNIAERVVFTDSGRLVELNA